MLLRRAFRAGYLALCFLAVLPGLALAHGALKASSPVRGARLNRIPASLRLEFTEQVELAVARVVLVRNDADTIRLSPLTADSTGRVIVANLLDPAIDAAPSRSGAYTIHWLITGKDGHPVRGTIPFTVVPDRVDSVGDSSTFQRTDSLRDTSAVHAHDTDTTGRSSSADTTAGIAAGGLFASNGIVQIFTRWIGFAAFFAIVGAIASLVVVAPALSRQGRSSFAQSLARRCNSAGLVAATLLLVIESCRLVLQHHSLTAEATTLSYSSMIGSTTWGSAWSIRVSGMIGVLLALVLVRRTAGSTRRVGIGTAVMALGAIAVGMSLSGHAAAVDPPGPAILYDTIHVLSAGAWIGTLALVLVVALPMLRSDASTALIAVRSFSIVAMSAVALMLISGLLSAVNHVGTVQAVMNSNYGRILLGKLAVVLLVMALGGRNQLRIRNDRVSAVDRVATVSRIGRMELLIALGVLLLTAILVATPTPPTAIH